MNNEFKSLSCRIGSDALLVQGAGGNTSLKDEGTMWVKASGTWLANALKDDLFVPVDYRAIRNNMLAGAEDPVKNTVIGESRLRPSIETTLHAFLPQKVIVHVHMVDLIALAIRADGEQVLEQCLEGFDWAWVPYARPGIDLTNALLALDESWSGNVLVLGNHGLVVGGDDCKEVEELLEQVGSACRQRVRSIEPLPQELLAGRAAKLAGMRLPNHREIHTLATDAECFRRCQQGVLYPDQAVFLGPDLKCVKKGEDPLRVVQEYFDHSGKNPDYLIIEDVGVFLDDMAKEIVDEMLLCHVNVLLRTEADAGLRVLSREEVGALLDWEPEKYRKSLDKGSDDIV